MKSDTKRPHSLISLVIVFVIGTFLIGCATNRGYVRLDVPAPQSQKETKNQKMVIRSVSDNRVFEDNPKEPSIPSLGFGGLNKATEEEKKRAIARKRGGYGKALGDILLEEGQTVETVVNDLLINSLSNMGYTIAKEATSEADIIIDVSVDKFWAWFNPGFWTIRLDAEIKTTLDIMRNDKKERITIEAAANNHAQMADTRNWQKVFRLLFDAYADKVKADFTAKIQQ